MVRKIIMLGIAFFVLRWFFRGFAQMLGVIDSLLAYAFSWMFP